MLTGDDVLVLTGLVFDDSCNQHDELVTSGNPCVQGIFGCSPPPILFNEYTDKSTGLQYACRPDPNSGMCGSTVISVCVSTILTCSSHIH